MTEVLKKGWRIWQFDQMATMVNDRVDDPAEANVEYYVGLEHLDPESLTIRRWGSPSDVNATKLLFRKGDIIFGRRRVYQRKLAVAHFDGICSAHAMVLRAKPEVVLPEFLPFFMQSDLFMERAKQISVGSLSPTINWKTLAKEEFVLPPMEEQKRVAQIYKLVHVYKEKLLQITNNTIRNLDSLTHFIYNKDQKLYETKNFFNVNPGTLSIDQLNSDEIWKYADLSSVMYPLKMDKLKDVKLSEAPSRAKRIAINGDILVSTVRPNLKGHIVLSALDSPIVASTGFTVLRTKKPNLSSIMIGILLSTYFDTYCEGRVYGTSYPAIRPADVEEFLVPDLISFEEKGFSQVYTSIINNFLLAMNKYEKVVHDIAVVLNKEALET